MNKKSNIKKNIPQILGIILLSLTPVFLAIGGLSLWDKKDGRKTSTIQADKFLNYGIGQQNIGQQYIYNNPNPKSDILLSAHFKNATCLFSHKLNLL